MGLRQKPPPFRNQLLQSLATKDKRLARLQLEPIMLPLRAPLEQPGTPIEHVYFMESGFASIVAGGNGKRSEVGIVGREGMTGLSVVLGNDCSPHSTFIQVAGKGMRVTSKDLRRRLKDSGPLRELLLSYANAFMIQTSHTAFANNHGTVQERLARWLLMAHDRLEGDELPMIHEFLSVMLGVRRTGVTEALQALEKRGFIRSKRGANVVLDRAGLEQLANGMYGVPEAEYRRLVPKSRRAAAPN